MHSSRRSQSMIYMQGNCEKKTGISSNFFPYYERLFPNSCHSSLTISPENIKKPLVFWYLRPTAWNGEISGEHLVVLKDIFHIINDTIKLFMGKVSFAQHSPSLSGYLLTYSEMKYHSFPISVLCISFVYLKIVFAFCDCIGIEFSQEITLGFLKW